MTYTSIVDNSKERGNLASVLNKEFKRCNRIAIATAYFNIRGFEAIKEGLLEYVDSDAGNNNNTTTNYIYTDLISPTIRLDSFINSDKPLLLLLGREPYEEVKWEEKILKELEKEQDDNEDSIEYLKLLKSCVDYFKSDKREVRIMEGRFFHGKCYIGIKEEEKSKDHSSSIDNNSNNNMLTIKTGIGVVGSSNFTYGGLISNRELNMYTKDPNAITELYKWFMEQWNNSKDFKEEFLNILKNYVVTHSPYDIIAKALYEQYKDQIELGLDLEKNRALSNMHVHQTISFISAMQKLERYKGVIIADSTGLGKTMVAMSIIHEAQREGKRILLIAPKAILDTTWKDEMRRLNINLHPDDIISMEYLSHNPDESKAKLLASINSIKGNNRNSSSRDNSSSSSSTANNTYNAPLIVVDEAHYFRNPSSNRYDVLREIVTATRAELILLTATPINTSLMDIYHLFALYLPEKATVRLTGMLLREYFIQQQKRWLNNEEINMDEVLQEFMVRHSRQFAVAMAKAENKDIHFPERRLDSVEYNLNLNYEEIWTYLEKMNFYFYDLAIEKLSNKLRMPDGRVITDLNVVESKLENLKELVKTIVKIQIFKRLESSIFSCYKTLNMLSRYMNAAKIYAKEKGYFVPPALKGSILLDDDEEEREENLLTNEKKINELLSLDPDVIFDEKTKEMCKLDQDTIDKFVKSCDEDNKIFNELLSTLNRSRDYKYNSFKERIDILSKIKRESNNNNKNGIIIFTQYYDTAEYLYDELSKDIDRKGLIMLISGIKSIDHEGKSSNDDTKIIKYFQQNGGILITTDKLAAGQNLQNAQYIINYDFPWNPVILIQRAGRVDRLGSPYGEIYLINILPSNRDRDSPCSLSHFLSIFEKLSSRLSAINQTIGLDASQLGEHAIPKDFSIYAKIAQNDIQVIKLIERNIEQFINEPLNTLAQIMNEKGVDYLRSLPDGIGAYKKGEREGMFVLFSVSKDSVNKDSKDKGGYSDRELYWRLKFFDTDKENNSNRKDKDEEEKKTITNPSQIISIIINGNDIYDKGYSIDYDKLIKYISDMKEELYDELLKQKKIVNTTIPSNKDISNIYNELAQVDEELAIKFRKIVNTRGSIVSILKKAKKEGRDRLINKAKEILGTIQIEDDNDNANIHGDIRIKRLCWCYITPNK